MHKLLVTLSLLTTVAFAQTTTNQTTITAHVATNVKAGQAACQNATFPTFYTLCDNTVASPAPAIGVFTSAGTAGGRGTQATVAINGVVLVPANGGNCTAGDLIGDVDGSGNLGDLGPPASASGPFSYIGICQGDNAALTEMQLTVQPGYVF